jgi:hypothetical protein
MTWHRRIRLANEYISNFGADWVSLQFVPYGFHDKGIVRGLGPKFSAIAGRRVHVMFHELWRGAYRNASLKDRLIGFVQRACIVGMTRHIAPAAVTTSNAAYIGLLEREEIRAGLLPLFGNIPVDQQINLSWTNGELRRAGLPVGNGSRQCQWIFAFFGSLPPMWPAEPLFSYIRQAAHSERKEVIIATIGRLGSCGERVWKQLNSQYGSAFRFIHLGEQSPERISEFLQAADFGIAASPWELIGKSGTVASMIEHGLPVIVSRDDEEFIGRKQELEPRWPLLVKVDGDLPGQLPRLRRGPMKPSLPVVAHSFLRYLEDRQ